MPTNCILIGLNAGADLPEDSDGIIIIGDNIRDLNRDQQNVLFISNNFALGNMVNGQKCNLKDLIESINKPFSFFGSTSTKSSEAGGDITFATNSNDHPTTTSISQYWKTVGFYAGTQNIQAPFTLDQVMNKKVRFKNGSEGTIIARGLLMRLSNGHISGFGKLEDIEAIIT